MSKVQPNASGSITLINPFGEAAQFPGSEMWFELVRKYINHPPIFYGAGDPDNLTIPKGTFQIWKNTSNTLVKLWVNDNGVMKSVTLL